MPRSRQHFSFGLLDFCQLNFALFQLEVHEAKAMLDNHPQWDIPETEEEEDDQEDSDGIEESEEDDEDND